jgi:hypothetical protein
MVETYGYRRMMLAAIISAWGVEKVLRELGEICSEISADRPRADDAAESWAFYSRTILKYHGHLKGLTNKKRW